MDYQEVECNCCGWKGNNEDLDEIDVCPDCGRTGRLQTDG